jgi:hypothetical protein
MDLVSVVPNNPPQLLTLSPTPPKAGEPSLFSFSRVFIQCIHSYPPYLEAVPSICNLKTHHVMVTGTHLTWY